MPPKTTHYELTTPIHDGVEIQIEGNVVTVRGPKGEITRDFTHAEVAIERKGKAIRVSVEYPRSRQIALVGTITSHIKNMMLGVTVGVTYKMKVVFAHFPPNVKVANDKLIIENFYGEKAPREAKILPGVSVEIKGDDIILEGIEIERVGQTAANIQRATRLRRKDPRKFHDGVYVFEKRIGERVWRI
jgi:large subunit ribosomal protein L6